jgi:hypothetical protein
MPIMNQPPLGMKTALMRVDRQPRKKPVRLPPGVSM